MSGEINKALVFGATGYVGLEVCRQLVKKGVETHAHVRPDSNQLGEWRMRFEAMGVEMGTAKWVLADIQQYLEQLKPDVIFILIGTTRKRIKALQKQGYNKSDGSYEAVDYGLTALAVNALLKSGVKSKIVYLSAIGTKKEATNPYLKARYKAEQAVLESGLPCNIVRAPIISGPDRMESRVGERIAAKTFDGILSLVSSVAYKDSLLKYFSIDAKKLAAGLIFEAFNDSSKKIFYVDDWR